MTHTYETMAKSGNFYYNHAIAAGVIIDNNDRRGSKFRLYRTTDGSFILDGIKFIFSQDFINMLDTIYIDKYDEIGYGIIIKAKFTLPDIRKDYIILFKLGGDKNEVHFWNDLDYIMENLIENFAYTNGKAYSYVPKARQISDLAKLTLGRI